MELREMPACSSSREIAAPGVPAGPVDSIEAQLYKHLVRQIAPVPFDQVTITSRTVCKVMTMLAG